MTSRSNKKKAASPEAVACQWFARCDEVAVTTEPHPVLGDVLVCQRCADWCKGKN